VNRPGSIVSARLSADTGHLGQQLADRVGLVLLLHAALQLCDLTVKLGHLGAQKGQHLLGRGRHGFRSSHGLEQAWQLADGLGRYDTKFGGVPAYSVDQLRPLPDQQLA